MQLPHQIAVKRPDANRRRIRQIDEVDAPVLLGEIVDPAPFVSFEIVVGRLACIIEIAALIWIGEYRDLQIRIHHHIRRVNRFAVLHIACRR